MTAKPQPANCVWNRAASTARSAPTEGELHPLLPNLTPQPSANEVNSGNKQKQNTKLATVNVNKSNKAGHKHSSSFSVPLRNTAPKTIPKQTRSRQSVRSFRRKGREVEYESWRGRIGVHVEYDEFDLKELESIIVDRLPGWEYVNHYDAVRLWQRPIVSEEAFSEGFATDGEAPTEAEENKASTKQQNFPLIDAATREVFIFSFGAVVFFNFPNETVERGWMQRNLFHFPEICGARHDPRAIANACDDLEFVYGDSFSLKHDSCQLMTREPGEKLAVSFGLAKSSLLSIYEWTLEQTIERNSHVTELLAKTGTIPMHKEELSKEIGRIFLVMHMVNLDSDLQDTPEEFWEVRLYNITFVWRFFVSVLKKSSFF